MQNLKSFELLKEKDGRRGFRDIPLCAYNKGNWVAFFCSVFFHIEGRRYVIKQDAMKAEMCFLENAYRMVFYNRCWSAREFARFLIQAISNSQSSENVFTLRTFSAKNEYIKNIIWRYNERTEALRDSDKFEGLVYIPFYPLTSGDDVLFSVMDEIGDDVIKVSFNYGLPIYTKFLQVLYNIKLDESIKLTRKRLSENLIPLENDIREKILVGIARNSVLWEPHTSKKQKRQMEGEDNIVINWREEYSKIWNKYNCRRKKWWREKYQTNKEKRLNVVKEFFN